MGGAFAGLATAELKKFALLCPLHLPLKKKKMGNVSMHSWNPQIDVSKKVYRLLYTRRF